jgi:hypothetical protein
MNHEWEDAAGAYVGVFGWHSLGEIIEGYEKPRLRKDKIFIRNSTRMSHYIIVSKALHRLVCVICEVSYEIYAFKNWCHCDVHQFYSERVT